MSSTLLLPEQLQAEMEMLARRDYPRECCGLLLGRRRKGELQTVLYQHPSANLADGIDRYKIDPRAYLAAEIAAKLAGIDIIGVWHSHREHPAKPSRTDLALAWCGWSYLIFSVRSGQVAEARSWRLEGDGFAEEDICHA